MLHISGMCRIYKYINKVNISPERMEKMKEKILRNWEAVKHCPELWRQCAEGYPVSVTIYGNYDNEDDNETDKTKEKLVSCVLPATVPLTVDGIRKFFAGLTKQLETDKKTGRLTTSEFSRALHSVRTRESATLRALEENRICLTDTSARPQGADAVKMAEYAYLAGKVRKEIERLTGIFSYQSKIPEDLKRTRKQIQKYMNLRACIVKRYGRDHQTARRLAMRLADLESILSSHRMEQIRTREFGVWQYTEFKPDALQLIAKGIPNFGDSVQVVKTAVKRQYREILRMAGTPDKVAETCAKVYACQVALPEMPYSSPVTMPGYEFYTERNARKMEA